MLLVGGRQTVWEIVSVRSVWGNQEIVFLEMEIVVLEEDYASFGAVGF